MIYDDFVFLRTVIFHTHVKLQEDRRGIPLGNDRIISGNIGYNGI